MTKQSAKAALNLMMAALPLKAKVDSLPDPLANDALV